MRPPDLWGDAGNDILFGYADDNLYGEEGDDTLNTGAANDGEWRVRA